MHISARCISVAADDAPTSRNRSAPMNRRRTLKCPEPPPTSRRGRHCFGALVGRRTMDNVQTRMNWCSSLMWAFLLELATKGSGSVAYGTKLRRHTCQGD